MNRQLQCSHLPTKSSVTAANMNELKYASFSLTANLLLVTGNASHSYYVACSHTMCSDNVFCILTIVFKMKNTVRTFFKYKYKI